MGTRVAVAGSTGSIGVQTLEVVAAEPDRFEVWGLGASTSVDRLVEQARRVRPQVVAIADPELERTLPRTVARLRCPGGERCARLARGGR